MQIAAAIGGPQAVLDVGEDERSRIARAGDGLRMISSL